MRQLVRPPHKMRQAKNKRAIPIGDGVPDSFVCLGVLRKPFGIRGALWLESEMQQSLSSYKPLFLYQPHDEEPYEVSIHLESALRGGRARVHIAGVDDRNHAAALKGALLLVQRKNLPPCEEDEFYLCDLMGLAVMDEAGNMLGAIDHCYETGAGAAILSVRLISGEQKDVPFLREAVEVSLRNQHVTLRGAWQK